MAGKNEYQSALDILLKLEIKLRESGVPEHEFALLVSTANSKIFHRKDIEEVLDIINRICGLLR